MRPRGIIRLAFEEVTAQMMFDQFVRKAANGPTDGGDEMHDLPTAGVSQKGAFDRVHLPTQATDTGEKLGLVLSGVGQICYLDRVWGIT